MDQAPTGESRQGGASRPDSSLQRWIGLIAVATLAGVCISLLLPRSFPDGPDHGRRGRCGRNLNSIGKGIAMYQTEHEDAFPPKLESLIGMGFVSWRMLRCPEVDRKTPQRPSAESNRRCDYFYLPPEGRMDVGDDGAETRPAAHPDDALMLCDYEGNHEGVRNVAFVRGNVKRLTEEAFQFELDQPVNAAFAAALRQAEAGRSR